MICAPAWGTLADMTGRRKSVLLVTFTLSFICRCSTYYFATSSTSSSSSSEAGTTNSNNVIQFAIALCVTSAFYAPVASLLDSIVVMSLTTESDKNNFGQLRLWSELGSGASSSIMINVINNNNNQRSALPTTTTTMAPTTTTTTIIGVIMKKFWGGGGGGQWNDAAAATTTTNIANGRFDRMFLLHAISSVIALLCMILCVPTSTTAATTTVAAAATTTTTLTTEITTTNNGQSISNIETNETSQQQPQQQQQQQQQKQHHHQQQQQRHDWKEGLHVIMNNAQLLIVFGLVATAGLCLAILENFCYINIKQLYTHHDALEVVGRDMSIYRLFTSAGGTLAWWYSGYLGKRLGTNVVMYTSICSLPICFYLYAGGDDGGGMSIIHWYTKLGFIIAEMIRSGIFAILWSTATVRVNRLCPGHVSSMVQTMLEVSYRGIGHTTGSYLGGVLCKAYDINTAFIIVGKGLGTFLCVVGAIGWFWSNHHHHHCYTTAVKKKVKTN